MTPRTVYTYDSLEVGQAIDSVQHEVTPEMVRDYLAAVGDSGEGLGGTAPPTLVTVFTTALLERSGQGGPSGGIHAKQDYAFLAPIRVGARITTTATVAEKFVRNGRRTVVLDSESVDDRGVAVARCRVTSILPG